MFEMTGVTEPNVDLAGIETRRGYYEKLSGDLQTVMDETEDAVARVLQVNDGPAADAFSTMMSSTNSITNHIYVIVRTAKNTATAYETAHTAAGDGQQAMKLHAAQAKATYRTLQLVLPSPAVHQAFIEIIRQNLLLLEAQAVEQINQAFNIWLPDSFTKMEDGRYWSHKKPKYGYYDEGIAQAWVDLDEDQRREVLQNIADAYADEHGYPRIKLRFAPLRSDATSTTLGSYTHDWPASMTINSITLGEKDSYALIGAVVHEMEHRGQYTGMSWRWPWQDEKAGMDRTEAEYWNELNAEHVRRSDEMYDYLPRPIEVDARAAERDFVNNLTLEEFLDYL